MRWEMDDVQRARYEELRDAAFVHHLERTGAADWLVAAPGWSVFAGSHIAHDVSIPRSVRIDMLRLAEILAACAPSRKATVEIRHARKAVALVRTMVRAARDLRPVKRSVWADGDEP